MRSTRTYGAALGYTTLGYTWTIATILAASLLIGTTVHADNAVGLYAIQSEKWPTKRVHETLFRDVPELRVSFLYHTFGTSYDGLKRLFADPRLKAFEVHLINEVCIRNRRCGPYEFGHGYDVNSYERAWKGNDAKMRVKFLQYVKSLQDFLASNRTAARCYLSPGLESNLSPQAGKKLLDFAKGVFPDCEIVWNPVQKTTVPGYITEWHGSDPGLKPPCISNLDGEDIDFRERRSFAANKLPVSEVPRYLAKYKACELTNLWISEFNLIQEGGFIDPRARTVGPDEAVLTLLNAELKKETPNFNREKWTAEHAKSEGQCQKTRKAEDGVKRDFVWKESDTKTNAKGEKVMIALFPRDMKKRFKDVSVLHNGKVLERMSYVYQYTEDGSNRQVWRSNRTGKDYPSNVVLQADGVCFRLRRPQFRID